MRSGRICWDDKKAKIRCGLTWRVNIMMKTMIGKKWVISGMTIEVVAEDDDQWETRNITTQETVFFKKAVLENAIKLGKAAEVSGPDAGA